MILLLRMSLCEHTGSQEAISFAFERVKLILKTRTDSDACVKLDLFPAISLNTGTQELVLQSYGCSATIIQMSVWHVSRDFVLQYVAVCCSVSSTIIQMSVFSVQQFPLKLLHLHNPPNRETQISWYLLVQIPLNQSSKSHELNESNRVTWYFRRGHSQQI